MKKLKPHVIIIMILALTVFNFPQSVFSQDDKKPESAPKYAMLIGVNEYIGGVNNLNGTHNDVDLMKGLLLEYGFNEIKAKGSEKDFPCGNQAENSNLKTLCSRQATKKAIIDTFKNHLIENAKKYKETKEVSPKDGANIVFYYSGHGSFLDDDNGDESDGVDETIVPTDAEWDGKNQIRDDELNELITELQNYTTNITLIFDNCNSGTATRGPGVKRFISKTKNVTSRGSKGNSKNLEDGLDSDDGDGYVTISGSLPNELSYEDYFPDTKTKKDRLNGALTYFLVKTIRQNPGATYRDVMNLTKRTVVSLGRSQTPQAEGDLGRTVFGSSGSRGKIPIFAKCSGSGDDAKCSSIEKRKDENGKEFEVHKIEMDAGQIIGANEGGVIAIYDPKTNELSGDEGKIGSGIITLADAFYSEADVTFNDPKVKVFPQNARIVLLSPNFSTAKKKVGLDFTPSLTVANSKSANDEGVKVMDNLSKQLEKSPNFEPVRHSKMLAQLEANSTSTGTEKINWDMAVVRATYNDFKLGQERKISKGKDTPNDTDEVFFISDRNGDPMYGFYIKVDEPNAADDIKKALDQHIHLENLRLLSNEASTLNQDVEVEFVRIKDLAATSNGCTFTPYPEEQRAKDQIGTPKMKTAVQDGRKLIGDAFYFRIENKSDKDLYLYIYSLDAAGKIKLLYPPQGVSEKIIAGKEFNTYGRNKCGMNFFTADSVFGKETIKILVSEDEIPANVLEQGSIKGAARGKNSLLSNILEEAIAEGPVSRNVGKFSGTVGTWAALNFDYEIVP